MSEYREITEAEKQLRLFRNTFLRYGMKDTPVRYGAVYFFSRNREAAEVFEKKTMLHWYEYVTTPGLTRGHLYSAINRILGDSFEEEEDADRY